MKVRTADAGDGEELHGGELPLGRLLGRVRGR